MIRIMPGLLYTKKIIYFFILTQLFSCSSSDNEVFENQQITALFSYSNEDKILVNQNIQFTNESLGIDSNTKILWDFGDNSTSTLKTPEHSYDVLGDYKVTLTLKKGTNESATAKEIRVSLSNNISERKSLKKRLEELNSKILVCAHRANYEDAPENSLKAINDAINNGISMVELDIRQTKDGQLVVIHDATIDRTTNGTGNVSDLLLEELMQFNLNKKNGALTNEKIPTLKQVLALARGKIYIDLDIDKKAPFQKVFQLVDQYGMLKEVLFYSSEFSVIREMINQNNDDLLIMPIVRNESDFNQYSSLDVDVIQFNIDDVSIKQSIKDKGVFIFRNAYVNTNTTPQSDNYNQLNEVINVGASIVQTDNSIEVKSKLKSQNLND